MSEEVGDGEDLYGVLAEFDSPERLRDAARAARDAGYRSMDAYSPFPIDGLPEALGLRATRLSWLVFAGGFSGGALAYLMQWYASVLGYPINVGGRPYHSWPSFVPVTFEMTVLGAALTGLIGMVVANGLPRLHHPLFAVERFELASRERFFLCIEARDPQFDRDRTRALLEGTHPEALTDVEL